MEDQLGMFDGGHEADHRADMRFEDERWVIRASSIGRCTRRLLLAASGIEGAGFPEKLQAKMDESAALEGDVMLMGMQAFEDEGDYGKFRYLQPGLGISVSGIHRFDMFVDGGQWAVSRESGKGRLFGHVDGLCKQYVTPPGKDLGYVIVEGKAFGPDYFRKWESKGWDGFPEYLWQVESYAWAAGATHVLMLVGLKVDGEIEKVVWDLHECKMEREVGERVAHLAGLANHGILADVCDMEEWGCPFWFLHEKTEKVREKVDGVESLVEEYDEVCVEVKRLEGVKKELRSAILETFGKGDSETENYNVSVVVSKIPERVTTFKASERTTVKVERKVDDGSETTK